MRGRVGKETGYLWLMRGGSLEWAAEGSMWAISPTDGAHMLARALVVEELPLV